MNKPLMSFPNQAELNAWNRLKTPIWIFDLQDLQMWWANETALPFWQAQTLEELLQRNWQTISPASHARLQHYAQRLQRGETISEQWTFYPKGNPISMRCTCSGINLAQGNLAMLVEGEALSHYESTEMNTLRALEAFRHSSALISLYDLRGNLLLQNPIAQAAYPEQITLASRFREAVSMPEILEPLEAQQTYHFEAEVQTKYGQRWHHLELAYTNDPVTGDKLIILTETDISNRKQVQGKYQQTSDQLEAVLNAIPGFVSWIDQQGHYLGVNDNLAQAFGRKKQDFIGQSIGSLSGNKKLTQTFHDFFQSHQKQLKQETFAQLNGENHYYLLMAQKYDQQQAAVTVGIDITERKQTQQQLKEQLKHSLLLKGITNKIRSYLKTEDIFTTAAYEIGKAFAVSRCLILSYQVGCHHLPIVAEYLEAGYSAVKDQYPDLFLPNHPSLQKALTVNHSLTFPQELSTSILNKLGSKTELILRTSYQDQANGVIIFQQCDIQRVWQETEIQILEEIAAQLGIALAQAQFLEQEKSQRKALEKAKQEAEAASRGKSEFLAMMSHEIRTPLNSVIGMTDLLLETEITEEQKEYLQLIQTSGDTLLTIIHDLLDFSKIEAGHLALDKKSFDLYNCIEKTLGMLADKAFSKGLNLAYRIAPNTPTAIIGDVTRIQQILLNLIGNALKFTQKGEVTVTVSSLREQKPIQLQFEIADTGIGIGSEQRDRLFKPFSQGDASTTRRYGGTGLGLVISQRLIQAMGGQIELSSEVGKGSVFAFTIMVEPAFELSDQDWYQSQSFYTGKTLLLSCENQTNRRLIAEYVCSWGMKVIAMNEREISQSEQQTFDVAIVDRAMPNLTIPTLIIEAQSSSRKTEKNVLPLPIQPAVLDRCLHQILALPTAISESPPSHSVVSVTPIPLDILLVEDNPVNQKVATQMLKRLGYQVTIANNGKEALSLLETHAYDLVLMDMQMPEMDGLEATRQIRQHVQNQPWIIAMTANAMSGDRERCLEAGMNDYLSKPLSLEAMKEKIATVIQRD